MLCVNAGFKALGSAWTVEVGLSNPYLRGLTLKFLTKELPNWLTGEIQNIVEKFKNIAEKFKDTAGKFILPSGEDTYRRVGENRRTFCENMRRLCEKVVWEKPELEWVFRNFSYFPKWLHKGLKPHGSCFPARNPILGHFGTRQELSRADRSCFCNFPCVRSHFLSCLQAVKCSPKSSKAKLGVAVTCAALQPVLCR